MTANRVAEKAVLAMAKACTVECLPENESHALPHQPAASPLAMSQNRPLAGIAIRLVAIAALAAMLACVKLAAGRGTHIIELLFYRQSFALLLLLPFFLAGPGLKALHTDYPKLHVSRMAIGLTGMGFNFWAVSLLPLAEATTIGFMVPIFATLLSVLILSEWVGIHRWAAIILGFAGVLIVVQPGDGHIPLFGAVIAITGALFTAWVSVLIRQLGRTEKSATTVFWFTVSSLPVLAIAMIWFGGAHDTLTWLLIAGAGLFGSIGQLTLTASLRLAPVSTILSMDYTSLIWATLLGYFIWHNWPGPSTWVGAPVIIGCGLYIAWREHRLSRVQR